MDTEELLQKADELIERLDREDKARFEAMGTTKEEFEEMMETKDELCDLDASLNKSFYVLKEHEETKNIRADLSELKKYIPVDDIRAGDERYFDKSALFVQCPKGEYFPDYIEENGVFLVSAMFYEYMKTKIFTRDIVSNTLGLLSEGGKRQEEYRLLIPDTVDCVLEGSEKYDERGNLTYFEIDPYKAGEMEIFRVKGFPHLIVANKMNRLRYSGFECKRIENFFDYEGEQDRKYIERRDWTAQRNAIELMDKKAEQLNLEEYANKMKNIYDSESIRQSIRKGLKAIFDSYIGDGYKNLVLKDSFILFFWSRKRRKIELAEIFEEEFTETSIELPIFNEIEDFISKVPMELKKEIETLNYEGLLNVLVEEAEQFKEYESIHKNNRVKLFIKEETSKSMVPDLIYDYKNEQQIALESAENYTTVEFKNMDLSAYDFSNKDLSGKRFENCKFRRTKFHNSNLEGAQFENCNLTGAEFIGANLKGSIFKKNDLDRAKFIGANLTETHQEDNDPANHVDYTKANLRNALIKRKYLYCNYFYRARLFGAKFDIDERTLRCVFRACDMRKIVFEGKKERLSCNLQDCDLQNSDLSGGRIALNLLINDNFVKTKLNNLNLEELQEIWESDFKWASFIGTSFGEMELHENDLTLVDLSRIKEKRNIELVENNLTYTNLSGFDFTNVMYMFENTLVFTDMSKCNFKRGDFRNSQVVKPIFKEANLEKAYFLDSQLEYVELSNIQKEKIRIKPNKAADNNGC